MAQRLLLKVYLQGHSYQRAGVLFMGLVPHSFEQGDLFSPKYTDRSGSLMDTVDLINKKMGRGMVRFAGESYGGDWRMNQNMKSPSYTTRVDELYKVGE
ncbi:DUF4113 domain-containing protein [Leucothrix arctica]|uniref:DUF4113 domain-containing protein n=1 Tax=Leucothrix arctica TaxID=1481894 RepID=A0A317CB55_9GAMM|nr:DUF4113 domain-containing protein [Leucothrix arctica]PWQ95864.1 hypothetical protein DKT75_10795 [Leucothrix arctica]